MVSNGKEKTGYPTRKPLGIPERIIKVHSNPDDRLPDFFAGSGTPDDAAARLGRDAVLVDDNPVAIGVMLRRLGEHQPRVHGCGQRESTVDG